MWFGAEHVANRSVLDVGGLDTINWMPRIQRFLSGEDVVRGLKERIGECQGRLRFRRWEVLSQTASQKALPRQVFSEVGRKRLPLDARKLYVFAFCWSCVLSPKCQRDCQNTEPQAMHKGMKCGII